ncbi:MAG: extracellular solute-binding protein [Blautia sp.]|nr:extracellular solute-binding protein [Lachnoclostridium sp.]MCM1211611.1 extracellular solute-binding protein [Blautia sp.]
MRRKTLKGMAVAALFGLLLTGCAGETQSGTEISNGAESAGSTADSTQEGTVSLKVWTQDTEIAQEMVDNFVKEHAGEAQFDILVESNTDADSRDIILNDVHSAADVFIFPDDQLNTLVAGGVLSRVPNAEEIQKANLEGAVNAATILDTVYAYPITADNGYFLYYNKDYFTEQDVQTLDRILEVAAENEKKFSMIWGSGWYLYSFFGNTGLEFGINEDGVTNYCNWNTTEGAITGADVVSSMMDIAAHPGFLQATEGDMMEGVQDGRVIAFISGGWNVDGVIAAWGSDYGAVKLPTYTCAGQQVQMSSFVGYKLIGVDANGEHVEWAHKLADYMSNEQNQMLRFEKRMQGPSNINAAASDALNDVPAIQAVIAQSEHGVLQRVGNAYWTPTEQFGLNLAAGNPEGASPQELIDNLVTAITASAVN